MSVPPRPWRVANLDGGLWTCQWSIADANGDHVVTGGHRGTVRRSEATANEIVRAVNAVPEVVDLLMEAEGALDIETPAGRFANPSVALAAVRKALTKLGA